VLASAVRCCAGACRDESLLGGGDLPPGQLLTRGLLLGQPSALLERLRGAPQDGRSVSTLGVHPVNNDGTCVHSR
jgi:hypothetical protein